MELVGLLHAAAREEEAAAQHEYPLGPDTVQHYVGAVMRRRVARGALLAAAGAIIVGAGVLGINYFRQPALPAAAPSPSITRTSSQEPSATPTPTPSPSPTVEVPQSATPVAPPPIVTPAPPQPDPVVVTLPARVTGVSAGPGGGSGEIVVNWDAVADATGYRVYRSSAAGGPFGAAASVVAATGVTTVEFGGSYETIQIWPSSSATFQYVEAIGNERAYFQVAAFNNEGTGTKSAVVCGAPVGATPAC